VDRPAIFAYHGYPSLIHRLTYRRNGHSNFHVRGYKRITCRAYTRQEGQDAPEITNWSWPH
jgi:phosphoketolase